MKTPSKLNKNTLQSSDEVTKKVRSGTNSSSFFNVKTHIEFTIFQWQLMNQSLGMSPVGKCSPCLSTVFNKCFFTFPEVSPVTKNSLLKVESIAVS